MSIKFKDTGDGYFTKIFLDEDGGELSRTGSFSGTCKPKTMGAGLSLEMQDWIGAGNTVEPQYTVEESVEKEAIETEGAKTTYIGLRVSEYPPIGEQLDYIYHNGVDAWKTDIILQIKGKFPKPF